MKIIPTKDDGSAEIVFNEQEIKIINSKKKLFFEPTAMKSFVNNLVHIATVFNMKLKKQEKQLSKEGEDIKTK